MDSDIGTDEAIAIGAAIYCRMKLKEGGENFDSEPEVLGRLSESDSESEIEIPTQSPIHKHVTTTLAFPKPPTSRFGGQIALKVVNKVPHSICTRDVNGYYEDIFMKGSNMPATKTLGAQLTFIDNGAEYETLKAVTIEIFESNDDPQSPKYNLIKRYTFSLPENVRGRQEATKETYHIDAAGNLSVNFKFKLSGKEYQGNVSKDELFHTDEQVKKMAHDVNRLLKQEKN